MSPAPNSPDHQNEHRPDPGQWDPSWGYTDDLPPDPGLRAHVLMQLMRHAEISTTMKYYATRDAEAVADVLWADSVNNSVNIDQKTHDDDAAEVVASADNE